MAEARPLPSCIRVALAGARLGETVQSNTGLSADGFGSTRYIPTRINAKAGRFAAAARHHRKPDDRRDGVDPDGQARGSRANPRRQPRQQRLEISGQEILAAKRDRAQRGCRLVGQGRDDDHRRLAQRGISRPASAACQRCT
jgi:hypothetical protein